MPDPDPSSITTQADPTETNGFPRPTQKRWQPLRSGLLNLFRYDSEEFHFADGRLLLRGNNGSGKSRVMALQLPFLLDGEISSHRVEPDGDTAKHMEWNLLMGRYPDRLGYTWIEFGRLLPDGSEAYLTLGCGLRAVKGQGIHSRWYFVTETRHGLDFFLQNHQGQPLGRDKLEETLGERGRVFRNARDYRRAIDDELFKLGPRYDALIELLIRLRQPQLSRKLDEKALSDALSEALSPLSNELIDEVAESFRGLESDREALSAFSTAHDAVADFQKEYRHYIRIAARRRAESVRTSHSDYESAQRALRDAERDLENARQEEQRCNDEANRLEQQIEAARQEVDTLRASPEMRRAEEVETARETARKAEAHRQSTEQDAERARQDQDRAQSDVHDQSAYEKQAGEALRQAHTAALQRAQTAELTAEHRKLIPDPLGEPATFEGPIPDFSPQTASRSLERLLQQRKEAALMLAQKNEHLAKLEAAKTKAEEEKTRAEETLAQARAHEQECRARLDQAAEQLFTAYRTWRRDLQELVPDDPDLLADSFFAWAESREGPSPLTQSVQQARNNAARRLTGERTTQENRRHALLEEIEQTNAAIRELEQGVHIPPPAPYTRTAPRDNRPGAPFWKTCDFHPGVTDEHRAGIESALEAGGLLDAWVLPDGTLLDPATDDAFLRPADTPAFPSDQSLSRWLIPSLDSEDPQMSSLANETIARLLSAIGGDKDSGPHWVAPDGTWRLGPVTGHWSKPEAEHIGESSRAAARRRRLAHLRETLADQQKQLETLDAALRTLAEREEKLSSEYQSAPTDQPVIQAGFELTRAAQNHIEASERCDAAIARFAEARTEWEQARDERDREARDLHLTSWVNRLDEFREALLAYRGALEAFWPRWENWVGSRRQTENARRRLDDATQALQHREANLQEAARNAAIAQSHYQTLEAAQGKEAREIREKYRAAQTRVENLDRDIKQNQEAWRIAAGNVKASQEKRLHQEERRNQFESDRAAAVQTLQRFAENRLLEEADDTLCFDEPPSGWSVTRAVEISRQTEQLLHEVEATDEIWRRRQQNIHHSIQELRDRLVPQGYPPDVTQIDDIAVVRVTFQGRTCSVIDLRKAFEFEVNERRRLLDAREREVIENHLIGEAASEMQRLLRDAENWVQQTNAELAARPTSTGMLLRFVWIPDPDGPPGLDAARKQLLRTSELWSPEEREGLARFLQDRIQAEQTENPSGSWRDHLAVALDYRRWHRFVVERRQDNEWHRLTRRTYGTGSGGEKALALTLPQFAAAAAHYRSACPEAPRMILLDEAFVGIDREMRAKCMGLLVQFDLDFVMTSESEWGCYGTVPSLSICHLSTRPGIDAVAITRWRWNGQEIKRDASQPPPAKPGSDADQPADSHEHALSGEVTSASRQNDLFDSSKGGP